VASIMQKDAFMDTIVVCSDGAVTHNKLTLGLVLPDLHQVSVFDLPVEHTILMPDHSVFEVQSLIGAIFPHTPELKQERGLQEHEVALMEEEDSGNNFSQFPGGNSWDPPYTPYSNTNSGWTGVRRGRGRPPLSGARLPARFNCDYCNKGFYYRSMLTAHEKLHTGGKRETCEHCGAEYSTRQNLKNHMIKYHGADSFTPRKRGRPPVVRDGPYARGRMLGHGVPGPIPQAQMQLMPPMPQHQPQRRMEIPPPHQPQIHTPQISQGHQSEAEMRIKSEHQDTEWPPDRAHMGDMPVQTVMGEYRPSTSPEPERTTDINCTDNALEEKSNNSMDNTMNNNGYQQWGGEAAGAVAASSALRAAEDYESRGQDLRQGPDHHQEPAAGSDGEYQVATSMGQNPHAF